MSPEYSPEWPPLLSSRDRGFCRLDLPVGSRLDTVPPTPALRDWVSALIRSTGTWGEDQPVQLPGHKRPEMPCLL